MTNSHCLLTSMALCCCSGLYANCLQVLYQWCAAQSPRLYHCFFFCGFADHLQVKLSVAGAQLLPCKSVSQERSSILQLPVLLGSLGAISVAASSCQKPSAAKPGSKMLSMSLTIGQLELSAAGPASSSDAGAGAAMPSKSSDGKGAVALTLPGVTGNLHLAKVPGVGLQPTSRAGSGAGTVSGAGHGSSSGREGLRLRQQAAQPEQAQQQAQQQQAQQAQTQQPWVLKATCSCQLKQQPQLQVHSSHLPPLLKSLQLLQVSLRELKARQQAAVQASAAAARQTEESSLDEQLPQSTLSPAVSLSSLPRPETPSLLTPCMSPTPQPSSPPESTGGAVTPASAPAAPGSAAAAGADSAAAAGPTTATDAAGRRSLASFGSGVLQRLPSKLFGAGHGADVRDAQLGLMAELSVVTEAGVSIEVTDSKGDVVVWLSLQEIDAGAGAEWVPSASSSDGSTRRTSQQEQQDAKGSLQLSAHALLQQLTVSVAPCQELAAEAATVAGKPSGNHQGGLPLHKLVQLDSASVQLSSAEAEERPLQGSYSGADAGKQPLPLQLLALAGQLQIAASVAMLRPLLTLAQQLYQPAARRPSSTAGLSLAAGSFSGAAAAGDSSQLSVFEATAVEAASAAGASNKASKKPKIKKVALAVVEVQLQSCEVTMTHGLSASSAFATEATKQAVAAGVQTQLLLSLSGTQLSVLPLQKQLGASLQQLQVGYKAVSTAAPVSSQLQLEQQSVELLLLQAVHLRQYHADGLQLLKVAVQQLRSDNHVDVVLSGISVASAVLQQGVSFVQQLQLRQASAAAAAASQQAAAAAVAAAATGDLQVAQDAAAAANSTAAALDEQGLLRGDSFSALAVQPILDSLHAGADADAAAGVPAPAGSAGSASLPPAARPGSSSGSLRAAPRHAKQKPVLALEAHMCDVAVQLSVCDTDALMVRMDQLNYSSVLEQAVITKLRFAINDRSIVQVPHAAVHNLPGWLPPGATAAAAAAAAASQQARGVSWSAGSRAGFNFSSSDTGQPASSAGAVHAESGLDAASMQQGPTGASANWQDSGAAEGGTMTGLAFLDSPHPCSCLGSRRPAPDTDPAIYQRQAARQTAGRERCKVPPEVQQSAGADAVASAADAATAGVPRSGKTSISFSRSNDAAAAAAADGKAGAAPAGAVISLEVYAERVLFSIPHDEAPGRIIVVCETWAKAVKEVSQLCCCHTLWGHGIATSTSF